jgi:hypothetical protein
MKKLLFVLAIVAVYGLSISQVSAQKVTTEKSKVTVVTDSKTTTPADKGKKSESSVTVEKSAGCCAGKTAAECPMKMEGAGCAAKATGEAAGKAVECAGHQTSTGKK